MRAKAAAGLWAIMAAGRATALGTPMEVSEGKQTTPAAAAPVVVAVCLSAGPDQALVYRAQGIAAGILRQAQIELKWRTNPRDCARNGIAITLSLETRANDHPGALAYARPFTTGQIVLLLDRMRAATSVQVTPYLLGHVLAHEVVHALQRVERHSAGGLMKPRWEPRDYAQMRLGGLTITEEDIDLLRRGLHDR